MSCESETTWLRYVEGELSAEALRRVQAHLVGCERCRGVVLGLREETALLESLLRDRPAPAAAPAAEGPRAARGLALGLPAALAATLAVSAAFGRLLDVRAPAGAEWLLPSRLFGVNEMLFDLLFVIRDRAPGLLEFAVAVAATGSVAMLVTFLAGAALRRVRGPLAMGLAAALLVLLPAAGARAAVEFRHGERIRVDGEERLEASLFAMGESVTIEGLLQGDLFAFAERVEIRGRVEGNVFAAAREVEVRGSVTGAVHAAAAEVVVEGEVGGGLYAGADRLRLRRSGRVDGDLVAAVEEAELEGRVGRDVAVSVRRLDLRGSVGGDLDLQGDAARLGRRARVEGDLRAHLPEPERLIVAEGAVIGGTTDLVRVTHPPRSHFGRYAHAHFYLWAIVQLGMAFAAGLALRALFPRLFEAEVATGRAFFRALGVGFATLVLVPIGLVVLALTLVGIPLALMGFAALLVAGYLAGIQVAVLLGRALVRTPRRDLRGFGLALLAGLVVLVVATRLPILGGPLRVLVLLAGLGVLAERAVAWLRRRPGGLAAGA